MKKTKLKEPTGIKFSFMGGEGKLCCMDCGYKKNILSFVHGIFTPAIRDQHRNIITPGDYEMRSSSGYQCLECGKFAQISCKSESAVEAGELKCKCGGVLSRDHVLFCPKCKSKNLAYHMEYIS